MNWSKFVKTYWVLIVVAGMVVLLDQLTKSMVRNQLVIGQMWAPIDWLAPYVRIVNWHNSGIAFGLLQGINPVFAVLAGLVSIVIIYYFPKLPSNDWVLRLALSLQLGGALGNMIDRIFVGRVTDFFSVGNLPVINLADASLSVGVAILIIGIWIQDRRQKRAPLEGLPGESAGVEEG